MYTADGAFDRAYAQIAHPTRDWAHLCKSFVRQMWGIPSDGTPTAYQAWLNAGGAQGKNTHTVLPAPKGAPVFFKGVGKDGHVAISDGHGNVVSTDINGLGRVWFVSESEIEQKWHMRRLGWSETLDGVRLLPHIEYHK